MDHVDIGKTQPSIYKAMLDLHHTSEKASIEAGLKPGLIELVKLRASQINGCAFCLRMHVEAALKRGETTERLAVLSAWRETDGYFTDAEVAALEITEYVTNIATAELSDEVRRRISGFLSPEQIASVHWLAIVINGFNRLAISSYAAVRPAE